MAERRKTGAAARQGLRHRGGRIHEKDCRDADGQAGEDEMSWLRCDGCGRLIDTDRHPEAYDEKKNQWICHWCDPKNHIFTMEEWERENRE